MTTPPPDPGPEADRRTAAAMLPAALAALARAAGLEAALVAGDRLGGTDLWLGAPGQRLRPDHPLAAALGWQVASAIAAAPAVRAHCHRRRSGVLRLPRGGTVGRWYEARRLRRAGWTEAAIARHLGVHARHVVRLVAGIVPAAAVDPSVRPLTEWPWTAGRCPACGRTRHRAGTCRPRPASAPLPLPLFPEL